MSSARRVVFTFDQRSLGDLQAMKTAGGYNSLADTVRDSLQVTKALQEQAAEGFDRVVVRNPETGEERVIVIPRLQRPK